MRVSAKTRQGIPQGVSSGIGKIHDKILRRTSRGFEGEYWDTFDENPERYLWLLRGFKNKS